MINIRQLCIETGEFVLSDVSLTVPTGKYGVLMGQTGSGKTTILEAVIGLRRISGGQIELHGRDVTSLDPAVRGVGYVPQDGALFPTMTVRDHLDFALMIRSVPGHECQSRVNELADLLGIEHLLDRKPRGLSGGERQRVAIGRALSFRPQVLCLDEPLSALDDETRDRICGLLETVQQQTGTTTLHVTHNHSEATRLADCLFRIRDGHVEQVTEAATAQ
ncbi:MAG: ABC transporter ATP-binding protein [Planctomycetaceae bacterium]|jgi:ABC-type sugar transport system ATPase subunit